jgi:hypothetical protein
MTTFTFEQVLAIARELPQDHVQPKYAPDGSEVGEFDHALPLAACRYEVPDSDPPVPSCLVGTIIERLHRPTFEEVCVGNLNGSMELPIWGEYIYTDINQGHYKGSLFGGDTQRVYDFFLNAQSHADQGATWGGAIENALNLMSEV